MAEKSFPFDAVEIEGTPDRIYFAEDFARYFKQFLRNGIYPNPSTNLQVQTLNSNMVITVKKGAAFIEGYTYANTEDMEVLVDTANASYNRKDIIVVQLDLVNREILTKYKPGTASANPITPSIIRTSDIYELQLAEILVRSGTQSILETDITDTRLNTEKCGVVAGLVQQIDTTTIFNSYMQTLSDAQADIDGFKNEWQLWFGSTDSAWQNWFTETGLDWSDWFATAQAGLNCAQVFDFDNWTRLKGMKHKVIFDVPEAGDITEELRTIAGNNLFASRVTNFDKPTEGQIQIRVTCSDLNVDVKQITTFNADGSIDLESTEVN